jgi:hypothetical protein
MYEEYEEAKVRVLVLKVVGVYNSEDNSTLQGMFNY